MESLRTGGTGLNAQARWLSDVAFETIHDQAWLAVIVISAVNFGFWQKLQLVSCILPLTLQEQKVNQSLTQASA